MSEPIALRTSYRDAIKRFINTDQREAVRAIIDEAKLLANLEPIRLMDGGYRDEIFQAVQLLDPHQTSNNPRILQVKQSDAYKVYTQAIENDPGAYKRFEDIITSVHAAESMHATLDYLYGIKVSLINDPAEKAKISHALDIADPKNKAHWLKTSFHHAYAQHATSSPELVAKLHDLRVVIRQSGYEKPHGKPQASLLQAAVPADFFNGVLQSLATKVRKAL